MGYVAAFWKGRKENTLFIQKCENNFIWRFIALSIAQPRVIHIVATSEQESCKKNQLIATGITGYDSCAPHKTGAGITTPLELQAIQTPHASFFVSAHTHTYTMVGCTGPTSVGLVSCNASCGNPVQSTASELTTSGGGVIPTLQEAANMATIPTLVHSQTAFIWRFIAFGSSDHQIIHVTARTEREARSRCPSGCIAVFAARIRQEVGL
ncbi:host cell division inhibitor Icd-like protein [Escherichia coli]|nr:host cell division inhibitor Icd-like protein [Escherichia coli]